MTRNAIECVRPDELLDKAERLRHNGGRLEMAYAWDAPDGVEARYLVTPGDPNRFVVWRAPAQPDLPSLTGAWPLVGWYEREIMDLYGVRFLNHPEPESLLFGDHEAQTLPTLSGAGVQELPFGPIRADVVESAEFTFFYIGERILHYHPRLFFKHRGMEQRFEGNDAIHGVILAERVSAVGSVAHALAYCQAVEDAAGCTVPARAHWLRVLLAELERFYNHLHYLGHLCHTTTLKVGEAEGKLLEERVKQINGRLTGSRFLRGILVPGGLRRDLEPGEWLSDALESIRAEAMRYARLMEASDSHLDRLITTGHLPREAAFDQGATGPIGRASGLDRDLRRDHPYTMYGEIPFTVPVRQEGDANARANIRIDEMEASVAIIQRALLLLPQGPVRAPCTPQTMAEGIGWAESPRGSLFYAVHFGAAGRLARVKIKSPSFSNWRVFPFTVHDSNMMDYAINEASFGLTISGCAR